MISIEFALIGRYGVQGLGIAEGAGTVTCADCRPCHVCCDRWLDDRCQLICILGAHRAGMVVDVDPTFALRMAAIREQLGHDVGSDHLIKVALDAVLAGVDTPALMKLASLGRKEEPRSARPLRPRRR